MRCIDCHYDLRQLTERRCPECGRAFDPGDPQTFETYDGRIFDPKYGYGELPGWIPKLAVWVLVLFAIFILAIVTLSFAFKGV